MKLHFYSRKAKEYRKRDCVSMPSLAEASFLLEVMDGTVDINRYQCPFGLKLHFYAVKVELFEEEEALVSMPFRASASFLLVSGEVKDV